MGQCNLLIVCVSVWVCLSCVQEFLEGNVAFSMKPDFRQEFCMKNVREGVAVKFINYVLDTCKVSALNTRSELLFCYFPCARYT